jgi:hypothetical protein
MYVLVCGFLGDHNRAGVEKNRYVGGGGREKNTIKVRYVRRMRFRKVSKPEPEDGGIGFPYETQLPTFNNKYCT